MKFSKSKAIIDRNEWEVDVVRLKVVDETYDFLTMVRNALRLLAGIPLCAGNTEQLTSLAIFCHRYQPTRRDMNMLIKFNSIAKQAKLLGIPFRKFAGCNVYRFSH